MILMPYTFLQIVCFQAFRKEVSLLAGDGFSSKCIAANYTSRETQLSTGS